jgi:hypothetical protein
MRPMDLTPTPRLLQVLDYVAIDLWQCVAEIIDNSLDNFASSSVSDGKVIVEYDDGVLRFQDNGSGMDFDSLERAIRAGFSSKDRSNELGLFGIGFNIACARLGHKTTVYTRTAHQANWLGVTVDIPELVKNQSYKSVPFEDETERLFAQGTIVEVTLKKENRGYFERSSFIRDLVRRLGESYSYILRTEVPGLSGPAAGNRRDVTIMVADHLVEPRLPCIWDEKRTVTYKGETVHAVKYFEQSLVNADQCQDCGYWQQQASSSSCENCGSPRLLEVSRKVWGWIGVQRFMHTNQFGIDFLRNGRVIQKSDKDIFNTRDDDSGEVLQDYPVEWPSHQGRIVGEVHCDHVQVDFTKSSFQKTDANWRAVVECVRGESSLQPKRARSPNNSPLSEIFNAFRINEPGKRYLIPGDGKKAINETASNWARKYHENDPEYYSDQKWHDAAVAHDEGKTHRVPSGTSSGGSTTSPRIDPVRRPSNSFEESASKYHHGKGETQNERMDRWKTAGRERVDLGGVVHTESLKSSYHLKFWETVEPIYSGTRAGVSVVAIPISGKEVHVFVQKKHEIFEKYGRETTDLGLVEAASTLKNLDKSNESVSTIYEDLLRNFPDEEHSEESARDQIKEITSRLRIKFSDFAAKTPDIFWDQLSEGTKIKTESNAIGIESSVVWSEMLRTGEYSAYLPLEAFHELLRNDPERLMDGNLFKQHYATHHAAEARDRSVGHILRAMKDLVEIDSVSTTLTPFEVNVVANSVSFLNDGLC